MTIRPDNLVLASELPTFINPITSSSAIHIIGTILNDTTVNFSAAIASSIQPNLFRADIYGYNTLTSVKLLLNTLLVMSTTLNGYSYASSEFCQMNIQYSGPIATVTYSIFNGTGADIILIDQTINLTLAEYQVPF